MKTKELVVIFRCDRCGKKTQKPEKDRWFEIDIVEGGCLCKECGHDLIGGDFPQDQKNSFSLWADLFGLRVELRSYCSEYAPIDRMGKIRLIGIDVVGQEEAGVKVKKVSMEDIDA